MAVKRKSKDNCYLYVLTVISTIEDVLRELTIKVMANESHNTKVALMILGQGGAVRVVEMQKLSVSCIECIKRAGAAAAQDMKSKGNVHVDDTFVKAIEKYAQMEDIVYDFLILITGKNQVTKIPNVGSQLGNLDISRPLKKTVKQVKVFSGSFTIGDPSSPTVSVPIELYPASRKATLPNIVRRGMCSKVTRHRKLITEDGQTVLPQTTEGGYPYLNEIVTIDANLEKIMTGEFEGAEEWPNAFEFLATVPAVPPWFLMEKSDYVIGGSPTAQRFLETFSLALKNANMNALVRFCHRKNSASKTICKGHLSLVVLRPTENGELLCIPLPFKEDFKSYYKFADLPSKPYDGEEQLDDEMDQLVDCMTVEGRTNPVFNPFIRKANDYIYNTLASVRPTLEKNWAKTSEEVKLWVNESLGNSEEARRIGAKLMKEFGIIEHTTNSSGNNSDAQFGGNLSDSEEMEFEFIS